ncbi:ATP-grasp domain-containing protein [Anaerosalibacter bizertensis]|uniref:ATP-grasp domain-containing protein n=1 Tax=Anaerosalibacter bizertensis TaxID=932217 RepID=UPI001C0EE4DE|nr:ATP-grasp domain-containing protein [Anaerosalibacter bizertensis]MBU5294100.1 ATP-grasp domain-containing protein [Anaerosalibacter bizertensis]
MKKIMIVGAGLLQSYIIKRAKELGYTTICVDGDPNAVGFKYADYYKTIDIVDEEECLKYAKKMNIDGVITAATDYGVLTVSYIAEKLGLIGNSYKVCEIIKNKYLVRKTLAENNVDSVPEFYEIDNIEDIDKIKKDIKYPVIVKPCDGSGSRGIKRIDYIDDLKFACKKAMEASLSKKVLIEHFIEGEEYGVESFVHNSDVHILSIMQKTMTKPPVYAELGHCSFSGLDSKIESEIKYKVSKTIRALGIATGSVNIDLLITKDRDIYIVDIGARMGGNLIGSHIVPLSTGIDYMGNIIKESLGEPIDLNRTIFDRVIATRLLALTPGIVKEIGDMKDIQSSDYVYDLVLKVNKNNIINEYRSNIDGCGYIVVSGEDAKVAKDRALEIKSEVDRRIIRY